MLIDQTLAVLDQAGPFVLEMRLKSETWFQPDVFCWFTDNLRFQCIFTTSSCWPFCRSAKRWDQHWVRYFAIHFGRVCWHLTSTNNYSFALVPVTSESSVSQPSSQSSPTKQRKERGGKRKKAHAGSSPYQKSNNQVSTSFHCASYNVWLKLIYLQIWYECSCCCLEATFRTGKWICTGSTGQLGGA